jgi:hypothetical protein
MLSAKEEMNNPATYFVESFRCPSAAVDEEEAGD